MGEMSMRLTYGEGEGGQRRLAGFHERGMGRRGGKTELHSACWA